MNSGLTKQLIILANYYRNSRDRWRERAYKKAIISIEKLDYTITKPSDIKNVKGIGKRIREKIVEYLQTGKISKVVSIEKELGNHDILTELQQVWGVGPVKATHLYDSGIRGINELKQHTDLLTRNQIIGLKYYEDFLKPIPRKRIDILYMVMKTILGLKFGLENFMLTIAGSYRRGKMSSGDIDCLVTSKKFDLENMVKELESKGIITDTLSMKGEKFMGVAHCPGDHSHYYRLDIEFLPREEWATGLLYFTGSKQFNIQMRAVAKKLGYTLNQHGLFTCNGIRLLSNTEKDVFDHLNLEFTNPIYR